MAALDDLISQIPDESLRERIRAEAVSYTHLDVYKRQPWGCPAERPFPAWNASRKGQSPLRTERGLSLIHISFFSA